MDLVVIGGGAVGFRAARAAAERGERVLIVTGPGDRAGLGRIRRLIRSASLGGQGRVAMITGSELACVDGVGGVEAVVIRRIGSGRLLAFNAQAVVTASGTE